MVNPPASSGLNKDDVERMVKEAEAHPEEDRRRRQEIEVRNQADALNAGRESLNHDSNCASSISFILGSLFNLARPSFILPLWLSPLRYPPFNQLRGQADDGELLGNC